ncbi:hypothetical protein CMI37_22935 [Candidatus Pacearchaeota archaeon]|nr:hypothetical protein [Candidatus Pacearchaeota archaeon]|tara:strand:- start:4283 stop:4627 length:345 start_codon:yes stop_codon:yes gene_type:complete
MPPKKKTTTKKRKTPKPTNTRVEKKKARVKRDKETFSSVISRGGGPHVRTKYEDPKKQAVYKKRMSVLRGLENARSRQGLDPETGGPRKKDLLTKYGLDPLSLKKKKAKKKKKK